VHSSDIEHRGFGEGSPARRPEAVEGIKALLGLIVKDNRGRNGAGDVSMNTNSVPRVIGTVTQRVIAENCAQRAHPHRFVAAVRSQPVEDLGELHVGSIDFFRSHSELGGATVNVQSFIEFMALDLSPDVGCDPRLAGIDKNNGKRLIGVFVPVYECMGVRGGFEAEEIQAEETTRARLGEWIRFAVRPPIENAYQEPVLIDSKPGTARQEILPGKDVGFRRP
jgi:hypothetical protein